MSLSCWVKSLLLVLFLTAMPAAGAYDVEEDLQGWTVITLQGPIHKKILGYMEVQPRIGGNLTEVDRLLVRPAMGYQLNKHVSIWQGYAWTPLATPEFKDEHRLFQQLLMTHKVKSFDMTNRTRIEQRFIEGVGDTSWRARHMLRLSHPIGKSHRWYVVGYEEAFVNLNESAAGPAGGFDQSRTFLGVGRYLNPHVRLEGGYMANYVNRRAPVPDRLNHVLLVQLMTNF